MSNMSKCKNCGADLIWDETVKSQSGKMIPLEALTKAKHNCPMSPYNKKGDKLLGGLPPLEAIQRHERELKELKERVDKLELEVRWGGAKKPTPVEIPNVVNFEELRKKVIPAQKKPGINWDELRAK